MMFIVVNSNLNVIHFSCTFLIEKLRHIQAMQSFCQLVLEAPIPELKQSILKILSRFIETFVNSPRSHSNCIDRNTTLTNLSAVFAKKTGSPWICF